MSRPRFTPASNRQPHDDARAVGSAKRKVRRVLPGWTIHDKGGENRGRSEARTPTVSIGDYGIEVYVYHGDRKTRLVVMPVVSRSREELAIAAKKVRDAFAEGEAPPQPTVPPIRRITVSHEPTVPPAPLTPPPAMFSPSSPPLGSPPAASPEKRPEAAKAPPSRLIGSPSKTRYVPQNIHGTPLVYRRRRSHDDEKERPPAPERSRMTVPLTPAPVPPAADGRDFTSLVDRFELMVKEIEASGDTVVINGSARIESKRQQILDALVAAMLEQGFRPKRSEPGALISYDHVGRPAAPSV